MLIRLSLISILMVVVSGCFFIVPPLEEGEVVNCTLNEDCPGGFHCSVGETDSFCMDTSASICGNVNRTEGSEECDDGNRLNGDGCDENCVFERCGNGIIQAGEACDDGNALSGDGCRSDCVKIEECGDGEIDQGEQCDDGNTLDTDTCTSGCRTNVCGDGIVLIGIEACDDGNDINGDACNSDCRASSCGDGIVNSEFEACDDGNYDNADGCLVNCLENVCGDGFLETAVEVCDDGNDDDGDSCRNDCTPSSCGDGVVHVGVEECDDGNTESGDGCRSDCKKIEECGDGILDVGEECDDANENPHDSCAGCRNVEWEHDVIIGAAPAQASPMRLNLQEPKGLGWRDGRLYVLDRCNIYVMEMNNLQVSESQDRFTRLAGTGQCGFNGDGKQAANTQIDVPRDIDFDALGYIYFTDSYNHRVRRISPGGVVETIAGGNGVGFSEDGTVAVEAMLDSPNGLTVREGIVYFVDRDNHRVRRITDSGLLETVAGTTQGHSGDGGPATLAQLDTPWGIAISGERLFVTELLSNVVRVVDLTTGLIGTFAGKAYVGNEGNDFAALDAGLPKTHGVLHRPRAILPAANGDFYITDSGQDMVFMIDGTSGQITRAAGTGEAGFSPSDGDALSSPLLDPSGIVEVGENIVFADGENHVVRLLKPDGELKHIFGSGDVSAATSSADRLRSPMGSASDIEFSNDGTLYVSDFLGDRV